MADKNAKIIMDGKEIDLPVKTGTIGPDVVGFDVIGAGVDVVVADLPSEAIEVDAHVLEAHRIASGVPRWGAEIDEGTIPATLGQWVIDVSVSFTKGCYTGQELVARIDSRGGHVPRRLVGIECDGPSPATGATATSSTSAGCTGSIPARGC